MLWHCNQQSVETMALAGKPSQPRISTNLCMTFCRMTVNEKAGEGRHSGVMMWPGSEFLYNGVSATFSNKLNSSMSWKKRVNTVMRWFRHRKTPANLVMMYFEEPDDESHATGPANVSPKTRKQIKRTDDIAKYIIDSLMNNDLQDVNVVFLSDHGMEEVTLNRIIDLTKIVGDKADMYGTSPVLQVYPKPGESVKDVYNKLNYAARKNKNFKVYLKNYIPRRFHIKNCERTGQILAVAEPTFGFQDYIEAINWQIKNKGAKKDGVFGIHGYDPQTVNMHPYFIAHGPVFKENNAAGELKTIDMFPMFIHILNLEMPPVKPNGTFSGVAELFKPEYHI